MSHYASLLTVSGGRLALGYVAIMRNYDSLISIPRWDMLLNLTLTGTAWRALRLITVLFQGFGRLCTKVARKGSFIFLFVLSLQLQRTVLVDQVWYCWVLIVVKTYNWYWRMDIFLSLLVRIQKSFCKDWLCFAVLGRRDYRFICVQNALREARDDRVLLLRISSAGLRWLHSDYLN